MSCPEPRGGNETARFHRDPRQRGSGMATGRTCAAGGDAGDRFPRRRNVRPDGQPPARIPSRPPRSRICRGPERRDRISLGRGLQRTMPALANELVHRQVTVIAAAGLPAAQAAKGASATIPIVFYVSVDPVEFRLVASLNWPRGNLSGITGLNAQLLPKRLEILHELMPEAKNFALLVNESNPNSGPTMIEMMGAARALGLRLHLFYACTESEITEAFISLSQLKADALVIGNDSLFVYRSESLGALTLRHAIPTIHEFRPFVASGGLLSYGSSITDSYRLAGVYTSRILKGEKPADLPVQQSTKVEMIINVKT